MHLLWGFILHCPSWVEGPRDPLAWESLLQDPGLGSFLEYGLQERRSKRQHLRYRREPRLEAPLRREVSVEAPSPQPWHHAGEGPNGL